MTAGTRIGPYEIVATLGAGGMGEVYRARDSKLARDVAIKILPASVTHDADRAARFRREAQVLAALNHRNIAQIFGLEGEALVMELVDGEDLAQRIARGALPIDDAIRIARQIADGLEAAHDTGIIHRDLKPANVKLRRDGVVKVLDFGLAKARDENAPEGAAPPNTPTFTSPALLTQHGVILGTAAYMAPEQARGLAVDRRADIWAFGCLLFEMLAGRRPFDGGGISDVIAAVLKSDPDWAALPADTPPAIHRLLRRCLAKDIQKRLHSIADARLELDDASTADSIEHPASTKAGWRSGAASLWPALAGVMLTALMAAALWPRAAHVDAPLQRLTVLPPPGTTIMPDSYAVAISPDGTMVAFVAGDPGRSDSQLWVRSLDSVSARRLEGADGAFLPFWSPDSRQIGFFSGRQLKTIAAVGGRAQVLADNSSGRGAAWSTSNVIVFAPDANGPLFRVPASGGTPVQVTTLDQGRKERGHRFPSFLPDGDHFLFAALPPREGRFDIYVGSLSGGAAVRVAALESAPVYADPGYLLYARQGVLMAQPFDAASLKLRGEPVIMQDEPSAILNPTTAMTAGRPVSVAANGSLAYYSSPSLATTAAWYDTSGRRTGTLALPPGHYETVSISPDGKHAAIVKTTSPSESTLWTVDIASGAIAPVSRQPGRNYSPVWSPDSSQILFGSDRDGATDFYVKSVADAGPERLVYRSDALFKNPTDWSSAAHAIVFAQVDPATAINLYSIPADGSGPPSPVVTGPAREAFGRISPDGRWLAFASDETGRYQIYVQPYREPGRPVQISRDGALIHQWSPDGRGLLFVADTLRSVMRVDVQAGTTFVASAPRLHASLPEGIVAAAATPAADRFLVVLPEHTGTGSITVVQNWRAALEQKR